MGLVPDFRLAPPANDGIGVYSRSVLQNLGSADAPLRFTVFVSRAQLGRLPELDGRFEVVAARPEGLVADVLWHLFALPVIARRRGIELLHLFAGNRRGTLFPQERCLLTIHDTDNYRNPELYGLLRHALCTRVLLPLLRRSSRILTVSEATRAQVRELLGDDRELLLIENGHDDALFHPIGDDAAVSDARQRHGLERDYALYVSVLEHPRKNHEGLLAAHAKLVARSETAPDLVLVGKPGWRGEQVLDAIAASGVAQRVHVLDRVSDRDLALLYNGARLVVHPSRAEGFGLPVLEAMACGVPVACSDIPALRELAGDAALYFEPDDVDAMARQMERLWDDAALRRTCSAAGRERAAQRTWRRAGELLARLYCDILGGAGARVGPSDASTDTTELPGRASNVH